MVGQRLSPKAILCILTKWNSTNSIPPVSYTHLTRLRCTVHDASKVDQQLLKETGASGVICKGQGVQVVYGPRVSNICLLYTSGYEGAVRLERDKRKGMPLVDSNFKDALRQVDERKSKEEVKRNRITRPRVR